MTQPEFVSNILLSGFQSCLKIMHLTGKLEFDDFINDEIIQDAVYWNLAVLGESFNRLPEAWVIEHGELEIRKIVGMRNRILHGYDLIDIEVVFETATTYVPSLKQKIENLL